MSELIVIPNLSADRSIFTIPARELNLFKEAEGINFFDPFQAAFNVFSYMRLTDRRKFRIFYPQGTNTVWQPAGSCAITPQGNITMKTNELDVCMAEAAAENCYDELFGSCFDTLIQVGNGQITETAEAAALLTSIARTFAQDALEGAKLTLAMGKFYPSLNFTYDPNTPATAKQAFSVSSDVCQGWVYLLTSMADSGVAPWANIASAVSADDFDGDMFIGDVLQVYDAVYEGATKKLKKLVLFAGMPAIGSRVGRPLIICSLSFYAAIVRQYREQCENPACINKRLMMETGIAPFPVYTIDGIPVVADPHLSEWDSFTTGNTHAFYLVSAGVIQLGSSFDNIAGLADGSLGEAAMIVQRDTDIFNPVYKMRSSMLMAAGVADIDLVAGFVKFYE